MFDSGVPKVPDVPGVPEVPADAQGLYRAQDERDACGVGFVVHMKGKR